MLKIFALLLSLPVYSQTIQLGVNLKANEFSITNQNIARTLFMRLKAPIHDARIVHGLRFRYDKHIFCVREPERRFHCHFYLSGLGEGGLQNYEKDHDYGKGSVADFITKPTFSSGASAKIVKGSLIISLEGVEGTLAAELYSGMDLVQESFHEKDSVKYEQKNGRNLRCIKLQGQKESYHACKVFVPLNNKGQFRDEVITDPLS